jgi:hypothetical protein
MDSEYDMSQPDTELMSIPLKTDIDISTGDSNKALDEALRTIAAQPGCESAYWGLQVENLKILHLVICTSLISRVTTSEAHLLD